MLVLCLARCVTGEVGRSELPWIGGTHSEVQRVTEVNHTVTCDEATSEHETRRNANTSITARLEGVARGLFQPPTACR